MGQQTQFCLPSNSAKPEEDVHNTPSSRRGQRGIRKGKRQGDGPGGFGQGSHHQDLNSQESGSSGDAGDFGDARQQQLEAYNKRHGINLGHGDRMTPNAGARRDGLIDDIYRDQDQNKRRGSRSNSLSLRPGQDPLAGLGGADQELDSDQWVHDLGEEDTAPVDRALYDPELDANWVELAVSSTVFFPQRNSKKKYIYQYTLRIWDCNRTSEAAATGSLGQLLFDKDPPAFSVKTNVKSSTASTVTAGSASSYTGDGKFDGVEQFQWYEFEDPSFAASQTGRRSKKNPQLSSLEVNKVKRLMLPYQFKYFKSEIALEVQAIQDDGQTEISGVSRKVLATQSKEIAVRRGQDLNKSIDKRSNSSIVTDGGSKMAMPLLQCQIQMEDMISSKGVGYKPQLVYLSSSQDNSMEIHVRDFKDAQKTLISFCIQVPPTKSANDAQGEKSKVPKESIFKNSRLMLHEIVDSDGEDEIHSATGRFTESNPSVIQKSNDNEEHKEVEGEPSALGGRRQRLEVVKITRCKMRAKDTLEIEIGLKAIVKKQKQFEQRKFILKFLDKLDPQLSCKGRIILSGNDLMNLQQMQFGQLHIQQSQTYDQASRQDSTLSQSTKGKSQKGEQSATSGCFVGAQGPKGRESKKFKAAPSTRQPPRPVALVNPLAMAQRANPQSAAGKKGGKESYPKLEQELLRAETDEVLQKSFLSGPLNFDANQVSLMDLIPNLIHVSPVIGIDFSMANLNFSASGKSVHTTNVGKSNQYRELIHMMSQTMYSSELYLPIFGYGAKTYQGSSETATLFPVSLSMASPLIPNQRQLLDDQYNKCLKRIKLDLPVKLQPLTLFLKSLAINVREKQEKAFLAGETAVKFPQVFYQANILTTGLMDDIDDVLKVFENSQWACLPIQVNFINIYQKNIQQGDLDSLKLLKQIKKYNNEIAGWKQLQIHFLQKKSMSEQMAQISFKLSTEICKNIEDYLFVNQLVTRAELEKLLTPDRATEAKLTTQKDLVQMAQGYLLEVIEANHQRLFDLVKKKIGMTRNVFDAIIASNDMIEWSVGACLHAQQRHDPKVIMEAQSIDEATEMLEKSAYYEDQNKLLEGARGSDGGRPGDDEQMLHESMMNQSILVEDFEHTGPVGKLDEKPKTVLFSPKGEAFTNELTKGGPFADELEEKPQDFQKEHGKLDDDVKEAPKPNIDQDVSVEKPYEGNDSDIDDDTAKVYQECDNELKQSVGKLLDDTLTSPRDAMAGGDPNSNQAQDQDPQDPAIISQSPKVMQDEQTL